ncbi:ABC-2 type transporter family protein [Candida albicans]|uniref:ABC-2 type transporter family protein n=1 Tax=Candida albicans TaxID=5476 RepID=A0A8H6BSQ6_CANAX|nr:ABC-2 type transporter family protein [Candida albicans]
MADADTSSNSSKTNEDRSQEGFGTYQGYTDRVASEVQELARIISHESELSGKLGVIPVDENGNFVDQRLNPNSPEFNAAYWIQNAHKLVSSDIDYFKPVTIGVAYKNLRAYGSASDADYQSTLVNLIPKYLSLFFREYILRHTGPTFDILKPMDGLIKPGELTVVLGRPGAGCSTFLKTIASQTYGYHIDKDSVIRYNSLTPHEIKKHYRGEVVYCAETENHFPQLTVGDTLEFAAKMRTPQNRPLGVSRDAYARHLAAVVMAVYGLSHTRNTKVGNDFIRGVSGGERKRVSIAEITLNNAMVQCWDNSTRGLDSATALEFIRALKASADIVHTTPLVAIYQCSQDAYDLFDKVVLMYQGYQIYFGSAKKAKQYFIDMGYECPQRQTTADFLTSLTNPAERIVRQGFEGKVPQTPQEFYEYWKKSPEGQQIVADVDQYLTEHSSAAEKEAIKEAHQARQSDHLKPASPYTVSFFMQVRYIAHRNILRIKGNPSIHLFQIFGNIGMSFILSSIFYNLPTATSSFYHRTAALFFAVLFNAFSCLLEIFSLYEARSIVEKHKKYALYHPAADAFASIVTELPTKFIIAIGFNLVYYFMVNFRRTPGNFFFYLLINFSATLAMSHIFRTIGAATKTLQEAMTPAAILLLALTIFTGFVIPTPNMHGWCRWINYLDPLAYAFESLIANEFHNRDFECSQYVPSGGSYPTAGPNRICTPVGSVPGQDFVDGTRYMEMSFDYRNSHKWRNFGIVIGFIVFFFCTYILLCEINKGAMQKGEILLFQQRALKKRKKANNDIESGEIEKVTPEFDNEYENNQDKMLQSGGDTFFWRDLTYQVKIKSEDRVILDHVSGWVKPGQVTALMGASGAGKTTLLNALSDRLTTGVVTEGIRLVNGRPLDSSFQRSIGYVQQQDLHLETSTVREALEFAAYLRQPKSVSRKEKTKANPAEWMLEVIGAAPGSKANQDYYDVWLKSSEFQEMNSELDLMSEELVKKPLDDDPDRLKPYAAPYWEQYLFVTKRVFEQNWRTPSYLYSKFLLVVTSSLFNGFSFYKADRSLQGLQNQMFSVFMFLVILHTLIQQYLPTFVSQRDLYEVRERPSKTFSWITFIAAQVTAEIPWNIICGTLGYFCWYYPVGLYQNATYTNTVHQRGAFMWFAILCISFLEIDDNAANLSVLLFTMCLAFCGVLVTKEQLPGFWVFMYRCSPFTYLVSVMLSVGLVDAPVTCAAKEYLRFSPPQGYTCIQYMEPYMKVAGGYLLNENSTTECEFCTMKVTNVFLKMIGSDYSKRGRDIGIYIAFIGINIIGTFILYWFARVPKNFDIKLRRKR